MRPYTRFVVALFLLSQACFASPHSDEPGRAPKAFEKKLRSLAGSSATNCGVAAGPADVDVGKPCVQAAHAQGAAFMYAVGPGKGVSGMWLAWAGTRRGKVYQLFVMNEAAGDRGVLVAECVDFEVTADSGIHCSIGPSSGTK